MARFKLHDNPPSWNPLHVEHFTTDNYHKAQKYANDVVARGYKVWIRKRPALFYRGSSYTVFYMFT